MPAEIEECERAHKHRLSSAYHEEHRPLLLAAPGSWLRLLLYVFLRDLVKGTT